MKIHKLLLSLALMAVAFCSFSFAGSPQINNHNPVNAGVHRRTADSFHSVKIRGEMPAQFAAIRNDYRLEMLQGIYPMRLRLNFQEYFFGIRPRIVWYRITIFKARPNL